MPFMSLRMKVSIFCTGCEVLRDVLGYQLQLPCYPVLLHSTSTSLSVSARAAVFPTSHLLISLSGMCFPLLCAWFDAFIQGLCE